MSVKETFSAGQTREFFGGGDFFRLLETVAEITVEFFWQGREVAEAIGVQAGYAEYFRDRRFDRIRIYSATAQDIKWVTREGSDVRYDRGAASITGSVDLNAATIQELLKPMAGDGAYANATALAINTAVAIVAPGTNTNGMTVTGAHLQGYSQGAGLKMDAFIYHTAAPASAAPATQAAGTVILANAIAAGGVADQYAQKELANEVFVPAGNGLYYYSGAAVWAHASRAIRWKLH